MTRHDITVLGGVVVAAALLLEPLPLPAQQGGVSTAGSARPKNVSDGTVSIASGGYAMRYYFQEGKTFTDKDAHVYHEPLIYLDVDKDDRIRSNIDDIDDNGVLTLYVRWHSKPEEIVSALRQELITTAKQQDPYFKLEPGTEPYRISVLDLSQAQFTSSKNTQLKSRPLQAAFTEKGRIPVYFDTGSRDKAQSFLNELKKDHSQLVFNYSFHGVSDETCTATLKSGVIQDLDLFKQVAGEGEEGSVARHQIVDIAEQVIKRELFETRCASMAAADDLMKKLLDRLGDPEKAEVSGWEAVDKLTAFDADSFKADVTTATKDIKNKVTREQVLDATSKAMSEAETKALEAGVAVSYSDVFESSLSGSWAKSKGSSSAEANKAFTDALAKQGIHASWEGQKFVPKSVDVHSVASLRSAWGKTVQLTYSLTTGENGGDSIHLTRHAWSRSLPYQEWRDMNARLDEHKADMEQWRREMSKAIDIDSKEGNVDVDIRATGKWGDVDIRAPGERGDVDIRATRNVVISAKRLLVNREDFITVESCYYRFAAPTQSSNFNWHYYDLGRDDDTALIASWGASCVNELSLTLMRSPSTESDNWFLRVGHWRCDGDLDMRIIFMDGAGVGRGRTTWTGQLGENSLSPPVESWCSH